MSDSRTEHSPSLGAVASAFARYGSDAGILGVAFGPREVAGEIDFGSRPVVAFIVPRKKPRRGARRRLADGSRLLPGKVVLDGNAYPTDVVETHSEPTGTGRPSYQRTRFSAGGPVANASSAGTFGCLVRRQRSQSTFALTNRHVAIGVGARMFFPSPRTPGAVVGTTRFDVDRIADEQFVPFIDEPNAYFEADAALVELPESQLAHFSAAIPRIGQPTGIFRPDESSLAAYGTSLVGKPVSSWSWSSGLRSGVVSHVFYVTQGTLSGPVLVYSMLIRGTPGSTPGLPRDSGKVWVAMTADGSVELVGLHVGAVRAAREPSRLAVATDMWALARTLKLRPC